MEQWPEQFRTSYQRRAELGRPAARLVRGLIWAVIAIAIISVLAYSAGLGMQPTFIGH